MLLVETLLAPPEDETCVFVIRAYSSGAAGGSSSSESGTVMRRDPTPLRFLSLVALVRVVATRFDMVEEKESAVGRSGATDETRPYLKANNRSNMLS